MCWSVYYIRHPGPLLPVRHDAGARVLADGSAAALSSAERIATSSGQIAVLIESQTIGVRSLDPHCVNNFSAASFISHNSPLMMRVRCVFRAKSVADELWTIQEEFGDYFDISLYL